MSVPEENPPKGSLNTASRNAIILTAIHYSEMWGSRLAAKWNSSERCLPSLL